jgi:hypothetical protein
MAPAEFNAVRDMIRAKVEAAVSQVLGEHSSNVESVS